MWQASGLKGEHEIWAFGEAPDKLAELVRKGIKTATCSSYDVYQAEGEALPKEGDFSVILDSAGNAVCIIKTVRVSVVPFCLVTEEHAFLEGEGDRSLEYWRQVHMSFLERELASVNRRFDENAKVVCEEFEVVYPNKNAFRRML